MCSITMVTEIQILEILENTKKKYTFLIMQNWNRSVKNLLIQNLLFPIIAFEEGFLPVLNFLFLLNFLTHSKLQLRSEFPYKR